MRNLRFLELPGQAKEEEPKESQPALDINLKNDLKKFVLEVEKAAIIKTLDATRWNRSKAAKNLGISRRTLFRKMKMCGLD